MSSYGYREERTVRMEPGPDGKLVPHVYIDKRPLTEKEAQELLAEQSKVFSGFDSFFSGLDGTFMGMNKIISDMSERLNKYMKDHGEDKMGRRS
jgi:hypothetical protein